MFINILFIQSIMSFGSYVRGSKRRFNLADLKAEIVIKMFRNYIILPLIFRYIEPYFTLLDNNCQQAIITETFRHNKLVFFTGDKPKMSKKQDILTIDELSLLAKEIFMSVNEKAIE